MSTDQRIDSTMSSTEPDYDKLKAQERLIIDATELIEELMEEGRLSRADLARRMERTRGYVTQVLGGRNLTLRTLSDVFFALDARLELSARQAAPRSSRQPMGPSIPQVARLSAPSWARPFEPDTTPDGTGLAA